MNNLQRFITALAAALCVARGAQAQTSANESPQPVWELGAGLGVVATPAYLGSAKTRVYGAPWPLVIYRGERLRANRDGVSLDLFHTPHLRLDLSLGGALPVKSSGTAREGMRDLPPVVETGAVLRWTAYESPGHRLSLNLPLRYGVGIDTKHIEGTGWIADPTIRYLHNLRMGDTRIDWGTDLTAKWQSRGLNRFYYDVAATEVRAGRPQYASSGGYAGTTLNTGVFMRQGDWRFGTFVGYANLSGAAFAPSPLVERKGNWFGGFFVGYVFSKSERMTVAER